MQAIREYVVTTVRGHSQPRGVNSAFPASWAIGVYLQRPRKSIRPRRRGRCYRWPAGSAPAGSQASDKYGPAKPARLCGPRGV
ncbi:hypothetical protein EVAR_94403_1 [Eumeta japonica]|uniref:Uncharacterized protein n=1 Tax=Eumeta variegata TaxID=151549 RepID=A0A4C1TQ11_EUMVA|nr:hypothetical protein EVAR_94403_1 [Eumeta japonica]